MFGRKANPIKHGTWYEMLHQAAEGAAKRNPPLPRSEAGEQVGGPRIFGSERKYQKYIITANSFANAQSISLGNFQRTMSS